MRSVVSETKARTETAACLKFQSVWPPEATELSCCYAPPLPALPPLPRWHPLSTYLPAYLPTHLPVLTCMANTISQKKSKEKNQNQNQNQKEWKMFFTIQTLRNPCPTQVHGLRPKVFCFLHCVVLRLHFFYEVFLACIRTCERMLFSSSARVSTIKANEWPLVRERRDYFVSQMDSEVWMKVAYNLGDHSGCGWKDKIRQYNTTQHLPAGEADGEIGILQYTS